MMEFDVATRRVVRFAVAYVVVLLAALAYVLATRARPATLQATGLVILLLILGLAGLAVVLGLLITVSFWLRAAVVQTRKHRGPDFGQPGFWAVGAFYVLFAAGFLVPGGALVAAAVRILAAVVLVAGVRHTAAWLRQRTDPDRPAGADRYDFVTGGDPAAPLAAQPTAEDWNASQWDPDVLKDIERRRYRHDGDR